MKTSIISYLSLLFIKIAFLPNTKLLFWVFICILADFITGYAKAVVLKVARTSEATRRTFPKFLQYGGAILLSIIIGNIMPENKEIMGYVNDGVCLLIIYIELMSICENFIAMSPDSKMTKFFFTPLLNVLTISIDKLPLSKNTDKVAMILIAASVMLLQGCKTIKESNTSTKLDSTWITQQKQNVQIQGATVTNNVDVVDSIMKLVQAKINDVVAKGGKVSDVNIDSLLNRFKYGLKLRDTVTVTDPKSKAELKYWFDQYGKLQLSCTAKDQTVQILVDQINRLQKEKDSNKSTVIVKEAVWYTWFFLGIAFFEFLIIALYVWLIRRSR